MKKVILTLCTFFCAVGIFAQTAVNKDGTIKFRGNVAIYVDSKCYTFKNGEVVKSVDDGTTNLLKTTLRTIAMEKFQNIAFGVVNLKSATTRLYDTEAKIICIVSKKGAQCIECHHKDI